MSGGCECDVRCANSAEACSWKRCALRPLYACCLWLSLLSVLCVAGDGDDVGGGLFLEVGKFAGDTVRNAVQAEVLTTCASRLSLTGLGRLDAYFLYKWKAAYSEQNAARRKWENVEDGHEQGLVSS